MNFQKAATLLAFASAMSFTLASSAAPQEASPDSISKTSQATSESGGGQYIVIDFEHGGKTLDESDKEKLRNLTSTAPHSGKISEYEVLAWADREYPTQGQKATKQEVDLAQGRAEAIKEFMKKDLNTTESVSNHNMAKRPSTLAEIFKTEDYKTKAAFQGTGAAPGDHASVFDKIENKASKAVIFVKYE